MPTDSTSDDELMRLVQEGNKSAFTMLFKRHSALVFGACMRFFSGDRARSEDASQEVWKRVVIYANSYQPDGKFRPWLWQIARNTCLREVVKNKAYASSFSEAAEELPDEFNLEAALVQHHQEVEVRSAIDTLPDAQRLALMLWISGEHSYDDIAKQLGCTVGAVKQLLFRARKSLLGKLEEAG